LDSSDQLFISFIEVGHLSVGEIPSEPSHQASQDEGVGPPEGFGGEPEATLQAVLVPINHFFTI
jgi:hypothetical protein